MKSKHHIEADRLRKFASLLNARAMLLDRQQMFHEKRRANFCERSREAWEAWVCYAYDVVWQAQRACIDFELKYPMER